MKEEQTSPPKLASPLKQAEPVHLEKSQSHSSIGKMLSHLLIYFNIFGIDLCVVYQFNCSRLHLVNAFHIFIVQSIKLEKIK